MKTTYFIKQNLKNYENLNVSYLAEKSSKFFEIFMTIKFYPLQKCVRISKNFNTYSLMCKESKI